MRKILLTHFLPGLPAGTVGLLFLHTLVICFLFYHAPLLPPPPDHALLPSLPADVDILVLRPAALREPVAHEVGVEAGGLAGAVEVGRVGAGGAAGAGGGAGAGAVVRVQAGNAIYDSVFVGTNF